MKLFKETIQELKNTSFPTKKRLLKDTALVINICIFSSLFILGIDTLLQAILTLLINLK